MGELASDRDTIAIMGRSTTTSRERIGDMLVALGLISHTQLDEALGSQLEDRIGKRLVQLGYVTETRLIQTLSTQLSVPWVSLERVDFSAALLSRISSDIADRYTVMPVYMRSGRGQPETLYVAMDDPTDEVAITEIARAARVRVRPMIAGPSDIRRAIEERYFGAAAHEEVAPRLSRPSLESFSRPVLDSGLRTDAPRGPAKHAREVARPPARVPPPPPAKNLLRSEGAVPVDKYATPSAPPDASRTLTFLDGTQLRLPNAGKKPPGLSPVTRVRHVVKAVSGAPSNDTGTPDALRWDDVMQAVLDAMKARGVSLTRNEVAQAWSQLRKRALERAANNTASGEPNGAATELRRERNG